MGRGRIPQEEPTHSSVLLVRGHQDADELRRTVACSLPLVDGFARSVHEWGILCRPPCRSVALVTPFVPPTRCAVNDIPVLTHAPAALHFPHPHTIRSHPFSGLRPSVGIALRSVKSSFHALSVVAFYALVVLGLSSSALYKKSTPDL